MKLIELRGAAALPFLNQLAELRIKVFAEWPYLYKGNLEYEHKYLKTYFNAEHSYIVIALDGDVPVGAATAVWLPEGDKSFQAPFVAQNIDLKKVCYYGESVLLPAYRGLGIGRNFMEYREKFARSLVEVDRAAFCAVVRPQPHPRKPSGYQPLNSFWEKMGFQIHPELVASYSWLDLDESTETEKQMQFWVKSIVR